MKPQENIPTLPWKDVISALRARGDWVSLRESLKIRGLPTGNGWDDLIANCSGGVQASGQLHVHLANHYQEQLLAGRRHIQLYTLEKEVITELDKTLASAKVERNDFHLTYPLPLPQKDLNKQTEEPKLCGIHQLASSDWALVFCSARTAEVRETINPSTLDKRVAAVFPGAHQIIAVRQFSYQAFDMVVVRKKLHRLELCVDIHKDVAGVNYDQAAMSLFSKTTLHLPALVPVYQQGEPDNLFEALAGIYFSSEGIVKSLAFRTLTGSVKKERMTTSTDDLRAERFHRAGADAVNKKLRPYHLSVDFTFNIPKGAARVDLTASIRELQVETPRLLSMRVEHCEGPTSLESAINKVIKYS